MGYSSAPPESRGLGSSLRWRSRYLVWIVLLASPVISFIAFASSPHGSLERIWHQTLDRSYLPVVQQARESLESRWFQKVYVLSLEGSERRQKISELLGMLDIPFEFFDASNTSSPAMPYIKEQALRYKKELDKGTSLTSLYKANERWRRLMLKDDFAGGVKDPDRAVSAYNTWRSQQGPVLQFVLTDGFLATALSHLRLFAKIVAEGYDNVLILEDDADLEYNVKYEMSTVFRSIQDYKLKWDILALGYTSMAQETNEAFWHPRLRRAEPHVGLFAMGYSQSGAQKMLSILLRDPAVFTARAVDEVVVSAMKDKKPTPLLAEPLEHYAIYPPLSTPGRGVQEDSEIRGEGQGGAVWVVLADSAYRRLQEARGEYVLVTEEEIRKAKMYLRGELSIMSLGPGH